MEENWENMRAHHERVDLWLGQRRVRVVVHVERALVDHGRRLDLRGRRGQVALDGPQPANRAAHHRGQRTSGVPEQLSGEPLQRLCAPGFVAERQEGWHAIQKCYCRGGTRAVNG